MENTILTPVQRLTEDMKNALRAHDKNRLEAIRFLLAQAKNAEIDLPDRRSLTEAEFAQLTRKLVKNTEEALVQFRQAGRTDLVEAEEFKLNIWRAYLPTAMPATQIIAIIDDILTTQPNLAMGPLIGQVMARTQGQADGSQVAQLVKQKLAS